MTFETITAREEGAVLFAEIAAPPMNLRNRSRPAGGRARQGDGRSEGGSLRCKAASHAAVRNPSA